MKKYILGAVLSLGIFITPALTHAEGLTTVQANNLIAVVQAGGPSVPASAYANLITAFSNITTVQANSLIVVVQAGGSNVPASAYVNLLISFTGGTTTTPTQISVPTISYINPTSSTVGSTVYVYGLFGSNPYIQFDGKKVDTTIVPNGKITETVLSFVVPSYANVGNHSVQVDGTVGTPSVTMVGPSVYIDVVVSATATAPIVDLKVNGSKEPLTLSLNQKITASWISNGTSCELLNVKLNPSDSGNQTITNLPPISSRDVYYDGANGNIIIRCSNAVGDIVYDYVVAHSAFSTNTPPVATSATITSNLNVAANTPVIISGTASTAGSSIRLVVGSGVGIDGGTVTVQQNGTWSITLGRFSVGSYPITVQSPSSDGTVFGPVLTTGTLIVTTDATTIAPTITIDPSSVNKSYSTADTLAIGFIATNNNFIDPQGRQFTWELVGNAPLGVNLSTEGAFYAVLRGTPTQTGNYSFTVRAKHAAVPGVYGDVPVTLTVTSSAIPAPTATITSPLTIPTNTPLIIYGTGSPAGSSINVVISSNTAGYDITSGSNVIQANGAWVVNFGTNTGIGIGSYAVTVRSYPGMTTLTTGTLTLTAP